MKAVTIKRRLLLSHLVMFAVPLLMLLITCCTAAISLVILIQSGNHVYIESSDQYVRAEQVLYHYIFHGKKKRGQIEDSGNYGWLIRLLDPRQNYVQLSREDGRLLYQYGNQQLTALFPQLPPPGSLQEVGHAYKGAYTLLENNRYCSLRKRKVGKRDYYLLYVSQQALHGTDDFIEHVTQGLVLFLGLALLGFVGFTSWFLANTLLRHILSPLQQLRDGARKIQEGDLSVHIPHQGQDEFTPVFHAFNTMTLVLGESLRQRAADEEQRKLWLASLSHDIRTPLTAIQAYVEGLRDGLADNPEKRTRYLQIVLHRTAELSSMLDQLSLFSRIDVGEKAVPLETIHLNPFLAAAVEDSQEAFNRRGLELHFAGGPPCYVQANRLLLERVIMNLFTNSAKYKDRSQGKVVLSLAKEAGRISLTVADDGPGVPPEALDHLFELFYRTDKARSHTGDGSGLGLAIVARAMELMHGSIEAANNQPRGLLIRLSWPEAAAPEEGRPEEQATTSQEGEEEL